MIDDDLAARSAAEASTLEMRIVEAADGAAGKNETVAMRALANALVAVVQEYLEDHSDNDDDVELFLEVHGHQPEDLASWPSKILADLSRHDIPPEDRHEIDERAVEAATGYIRTSSPLAWG